MKASLDGLWFFIIVFELALYGVLDGADLGIGMLALFTRNEKHRRIMIESISPLWYANETWLVVAGASLFGAFPLVYSIVLNALYIPVMMMLFGLIFRAVSLEFGMQSRGFASYSDTSKMRIVWEKSFGAGSVVAILGEAGVLAGVLGGVKNDGEVFTGRLWDWVHPLTGLVVVGFLFGFTMIGNALLIMKTEGDLQRKNYSSFRISSTFAFAAFVATMVMLPFIHDPLLEQWLSVPNRYYLVFFSLAVFSAFVLLILQTRSERRREVSGVPAYGHRISSKHASLTRAPLEQVPFVMSLVIFSLSLGGVSIGIYPYVLPPSITVQMAAAPRQTLLFMLFGVGVLVPVIFVYNMYVQGVFRGKVREENTDTFY